MPIDDISGCIWPYFEVMALSKAPLWHMDETQISAEYGKRKQVYALENHIMANLFPLQIGQKMETIYPAWLQYLQVGLLLLILYHRRN